MLIAICLPISPNTSLITMVLKYLKTNIYGTLKKKKHSLYVAFRTRKSETFKPVSYCSGITLLSIFLISASLWYELWFEILFHKCWSLGLVQISKPISPDLVVYKDILVLHLCSLLINIQNGRSLLKKKGIYSCSPQTRKRSRKLCKPSSPFP